MKKFNFHKTYEERAEALRTFKANDMDSRAECFDMLQEIIVDQGVGTRQVLEDLKLDDLVNDAAFLNLSITEAIHEILDRVPSKDVRAYAATFKADDIALENKMAQDNLQSDLSSILQKAGIKASIEPRISEDGKVTLYAYTRKQMYRWEEKLEAMGFKVHAYPEQGAFLVKFSMNPVKAQDAEPDWSLENFETLVEEGYISYSEIEENYGAGLEGEERANYYQWGQWDREEIALGEISDETKEYYIEEAKQEYYANQVPEKANDAEIKKLLNLFDLLWYYAVDLKVIDLDDYATTQFPYENDVEEEFGYFFDGTAKQKILDIIAIVSEEDILAFTKELLEGSEHENIEYPATKSTAGKVFNLKNMDKAHDAERPEKKIIEITEADEDRWEEIIRCFDAFKNKLDAQVREFLNDRDQQPEGALTLEDVEDVLYRYTVLAGKHAFDFEEKVEVEEPEQEEVEAVEEEIPAEEEEDELEKLLSEE
jgi:hypothetical protein